MPRAESAGDTQRYAPMPTTLTFLLLVLSGLMGCTVPDDRAAAAVPDDPAKAVLDAFSTHRVVAIGENHGHADLHAIVFDLLERPEAPRLIDDIAIEWGNSLYQHVVDRYVAGADVPWDSVTMAWRNTIVSPNTVWDAPMYGHFLTRIRAINEDLPDSSQYRVLLTDTPVDWSAVESRQDLGPFFDRAAHMADVIRNESLRKGRRSLFVAGGLHVSRLPRRHVNQAGIPFGEITPVAWLELRHPGTVFVIQSMGRAAELGLDELTTSGNPKYIDLQKSIDAGHILANRSSTLKNRDGSPLDVYGEATLSDIIDAAILWDPNTVVLEDEDRSAYQDAWYWDELNRRSMIMRGEPMDSSLRNE